MQPLVKQRILNHTVRSSVSRADLVEMFIAFGKSGLIKSSGSAGFEYVKPVKKKESKPDKTPFKGTAEKKVHVAHKFIEIERQYSYWRVSGHKKKDEKINQDIQVWFKGIPEIDITGLKPDTSIKLSEQQDLVPWPTMWPFLKSVLGCMKETSKLDIPKIVKKVAGLTPLMKIPKIVKPGWAEESMVLFDFSNRLVPFWGDMERLHKGIIKIRGKRGLGAFKILTTPNDDLVRFNNHKGLPGKFKLPSCGSPILIISDLGCFDKSGVATEDWISFGEKLYRAGVRPLVLTLAPSRLMDQRLFCLYEIAFWDRGIKLLFKLQEKNENSEAPEIILTLLAASLRVEPSYLRDIRYILPAGMTDTGHEAEIWQHSDVQSCLSGFAFKTSAHEKYKEKFMQIRDKKLKSRALGIMKQHHMALSPVIKYEEGMNASILMDQIPDDMEKFFLSCLKSYGKGYTGFDSWIRRVSSRLGKTSLARSAMQIFWAKVNRENWEKGKLVKVEGVTIEDVAGIIGEKGEMRTYPLYQEGVNFYIRKSKDTGNYSKGSFIHDIASKDGILEVRKGLKTTESTIYNLNIKDIEIEIPKAEGFLILSSDMEEITLQAMAKPEWAEGIGRDEYGLFAKVKVNSVAFKMRYIFPGEFLMGSDLNKIDRDDDEVQHKVVLSQGVWLCETACTQQLWKAVLNDNPSDFIKDENPVDSVSWKDCRKFLKQINKLKSGLNLRLPTEAEWEYACRAGTQTPFSFGKNITTDQVNYDGYYPYADGEKGKKRGETVPVKSLPCNDWGLYEMHGNVLEWCRDWYCDYTDKIIIDPEGSETGDSCVLRGGSWISVGGRVRSADRFWDDPGLRFHYFGFRFARGQARPSGRFLRSRKGKNERTA